MDHGMLLHFSYFFYLNDKFFSLVGNFLFLYSKKKGTLLSPPLHIWLHQTYLLFSHFWLATVQEVLQADWQEVWHSPQPPLQALSFKDALFKVLMCFM
jgi:hypothetical protein